MSGSDHPKNKNSCFFLFPVVTDHHISFLHTLFLSRTMSARKYVNRTVNTHEWCAEQELVAKICEIGRTHRVKVFCDDIRRTVGKLYLRTELLSINETHEGFIAELKKECRATLEINQADVYYVSVPRPRLWSYWAYSLIYLAAGFLLLLVWWYQLVYALFTRLGARHWIGHSGPLL